MIFRIENTSNKIGKNNEKNKKKAKKGNGFCNFWILSNLIQKRKTLEKKRKKTNRKKKETRVFLQQFLDFA